MDIIISVVAKIAEYMVAPIGRQFGYIHYYKGNLERLKTKVQKLEGNKDCVQHSVDEAKGNGEEIENIVQNWLRKVDHTVAEAKKFVDTEGHANAECCMGHIPNLWTRHHLSKKTKKMTQEISEVLAEGRFDRISYRAASQVTATPFGRGYEALDSRTSMLNEIMLALKDPNMFIIGVYGMGGVGKTTLVKELAWQVEKDGSFGAIVMAAIASSPDVENIQGEIADALDLKFDKETKGGRARKLRERISKEKRILIILDDIWGSLDLVEVGIPFGDEHKGCKLVLTSRDLNVLNCEMRTQREFRLEVLLEEDSWKLFEKMAGDVVQEFNIKPIAVQVARYCGGLPLLIVTVAKALRKKDVSAWKDASSQLERFDQEGLHKKVYSTLELSYNLLESDELKSLFLFIGSYGPDYIHTGVVFLCCWVLGLYRSVHTLTEARNRHYSLISDLRASSLLLERQWDFAFIHDLVRDTAKSIASGVRPTYAVQRYTVIKEWPNVDQLKKCHYIIVPDSYIHELPEKLECPELELLVLQTKGDLLKVPDEFFSGMREVKVLRLRGMMFNPSPPPSLHLLTKIQALDLSDCMLRDIAILAELTSLEILSLERTDIKELPKQIGQLVYLRMLNLNNCSELRIIPANLFSSLTCLEELYMGGCFFHWGIKGESENASLDELCNLSQLKTLEIMIQDASVFPRDLQFFEKLENYSIFIGDNWKWPLRWSCGTSEPSRILKLTENNITSILLNHGFAFLLKTVEDMCLSGVTCVRDVLYELNREGFPQLKHLHIQCSSELKYIINSMGRVDHLSSAFPNLETLAFQNLVNLEDVCHGFIPPHSFTKLKKIEVSGCDKLKNVLSYSLVRGLPQLLEIKISECKLMTEVIAEQTLEEGNNEMDKIVFPKLHSLTLECLPSLTSFYSLPSTANVGSVALFDQKVEMPDLKTMELSNINSCKLWDGQLSGHSSIQSLTSLTIDKCGNIAYVFSSSVARELANLQYLRISNCQMLEEIFAFDGNLSNLASAHKPHSDEEVIFPNLETLVISHTDHLKSVWHNQLAPNSFCKLKKLETKFCNKLSNVIPSYVLSKLQNLETMIVINCPALEVVYEMQDLNTRVDSQERLQMQLKTLTLEHLPMLKHIWSSNSNRSFRFQNLCQVKVTECESLSHVFPLSVAKELPHLQVLYIENCGVENIVVAQDEMADTIPILVFPELTSLSLRSLKQLRSFSHSLHTMDCPVLAVLDVFHCDQLDLVMPKSLNHREIVPVEPRPLLSIGKVFPNLRELTLSSKDVTMLCNGQLDELIYTLKALHLTCFHDKSDKFPSAFLQKFINLENLNVICSSFIEIFSSGSFGTGDPETTMKLRSLKLDQLSSLEFICEGISEMHPVLQNLESLELFRCSSLKTIGPSLMLFQNLEMLQVAGCAGVENIITPSSSATSLPKLRELSIHDCEKIEEIVASNDGSDASELAFMKLERLQLINLPRLKSFCKGHYSFKFPLLETVFVEDCPVMETFSHGVLNAAKLRKVSMKTKNDWRWNGDLNTTIQTLFRETNSREG